jgi:rubrerythrin
LEITLTAEDLCILETCRDIELLSEQLYSCFAALFSEDKELAALWVKTSSEEANHARQFLLAIRNKKDMLKSVAIDAGPVDRAFKLVSNLLESAKKNPPNAAEALRIAIKLEEHLACMHLECIAVFTEESNKMLFRAMMANDNRHTESLLEAQRKYSTFMQTQFNRQ